MEAKIIICKNCRNQFTGKFCNNCGEKVYTEKDRSVVHFFEESLHFVTHFDGKLFSTLKKIFTKPGQLSLDYCNGKRKSYFKPLSLFLLLVVLYLLFPFFEGLNMKAYYHMQNGLYGLYAQNQVNHILENRHITLQQLETVFHHKSETTSKFLLLIIIPFSALFFWLFTYKKRKYFFDQMVFSAEINCVYLLWGFLLQPLLYFLLEKIYHLFTGSYFNFPEWVVGMLTSLLVVVYTGIAARRFYTIKIWQAVGLGLLFGIANLFIVHYIYKFILFVIVIHLI